jgi:hypothetical protein
MAIVKSIFTWIKLNFKWFLFILASLGVAILAIIISSKNKKVRGLEAKLASLEAQIRINQIEVQYDTTVDEFNSLRERDKEAAEKLKQIELDLKTELEGVMTAEEIVAEFKRIGL